MKNVAQMENDMERWLSDRERVSKQIDSVRKRKEAIERNSGSQVFKVHLHVSNPAIFDRSGFIAFTSRNFH